MWCVASDRGRQGRVAARVAAALWLAAAAAAAATQAAPTLKLDCPPVVPAQEPFDCTVTADPSGGAAGSVVLTLPPRLMRVAEPAGWSFDVNARRWTGPAPAMLTLIADTHARGGTHALAARWSPAGLPAVDAVASVGVGGADVIDLGVATLPLPPWVFSAVWLLAMATLVGVARQRDLGRVERAPRAWPWALGVAVLATLALPTVTALVDQVRARTVYGRAACEVLDHAASPAAGQPDAGWPMAALRVSADGDTWVSTGFEPRTAIYRESAADDHLRFPRGSRPACWVDPSRPEHVILRQAPVAALFVGPAVLAALGVLGVGLRRVW